MQIHVTYIIISNYTENTPTLIQKQPTHSMKKQTTDNYTHSK